jgi:hypothetical protein
VVITLFGLSEEFTLLKFGLGLVAKFCLRIYSDKAKGSVLAPRVMAFSIGAKPFPIIINYLLKNY